MVDLINDLKAAKVINSSDAEMTAAQGFRHKTQFYLYFVEAKNSAGFHAPHEAAHFGC